MWLLTPRNKNSGMDPAARRFVWDLLQRNRKSRAIILTTRTVSPFAAPQFLMRFSSQTLWTKQTFSEIALLSYRKESFAVPAVPSS